MISLVRRRAAGLAAAAAVGLLAAGLVGGGVAAEVTEPEIIYESWYFRGKPNPPVVDTCTPVQDLLPTDCGPVGPGPAFPPAPQAPDTGSYVTSFAGGEPGDGDGEGDTGWQAWQWDVFAAAGGSVQEFVVTFTQDPRNRGDFNEPQPDGSGGVIQACNIVGPWAGAPGANPWPERPTVDCSTAEVPVVEKDDAGRLTYTFDLTLMASKWIEGAGYGVVIRPGAPGAQSPLEPFQVTFAGYQTSAENPEQVWPRVTFRFEPLDLDLDLDLDLGDFGGGFDDGGFVGGGDFAPPPDVGSFPDPGGRIVAPPEPAGDDLAAPGPRRAVPASADTAFPWFLAALLAALAAVAFWSTGTSLGPAGEPVPVRQGGVSQVLAERRAARAAGDLPPIDR